MHLAAKFLVTGEALGELSILSAPLSLWGGYDVQTGTIIDITHPQRGLSLARRVLAMRETRGSSSSSSVLVEAARCGTAPSAIILERLDPILVIGGLVAGDLYGVAIPILLLQSDLWPLLPDGATVCISTEASEIVFSE